MIAKIIDEFKGNLVRDNIGDMSNGNAKYDSTFGNDPFSNPGNLTWMEQATQIDPSASVITDMIMDGKERVESGISYVYAIGHTGRLYKIQVNDPASHNPDYDNPVLLTTLTINTPTFTRGGSMDFYGATEKIFIGHDKGVTKVNFDGSGEAFVGVLGTWTQTVPRQLKQFVGSIFVGNGNNIAQIDSTELVVTYGKLTPSFPSNTQVRDLDISPDGNYLEAVVSRLSLPDLTAVTQDTTYLSNSESYIFKWNGVDAGYTSFDTFPSFSLNANSMFGNYQYTFGYDLVGAAVFNPTRKILSPVLSQAPLPNAIGSNANLIGWSTTEFYQGFSRMVNFVYGSLDDEVGPGWWRQYAQSATGSETDVLRVPYSMPVSNFVLGSVTNGYTGGVAGVAKIYFSTLETSAAPTTKYKFYKWKPVALGSGTAIQGVYETQNQTSIPVFRAVLKKRLRIAEVRVYTEGLVANNSFKIDIIGPNGNAMTNGSYTFTVGSNCSVGDYLVAYNPNIAPAHSLGIRITNLGTVNWICDKIEYDIDEMGK